MNILARLDKNNNLILAGTFILVVFGTGSVAQSVLSLGQKGDFFAINWGSVVSQFLENI